MIHLTDHAAERAKERLGWNRDATTRMADRAFTEGLTHAETRGRLNRYLTKLYMTHRSANNTRVYGEHVYLFAGDVLVTILQLPHEMRRAAHTL